MLKMELLKPNKTIKMNVHANLIVLFWTMATCFGFSQQKDSLGGKYQNYSINDSVTFQYSKPRIFDMVTNIPGDLVDFGGFLIQKENLFWVGSSVVSTAAIIPFDQDILDGASQLGSNFGWDKDHSYSKIGGVLRVIPNDINSAVYYMGNGGTTLLLSGGFFAFGLINNNYRSLNTASELVEVLFTVGVITQTIKRITGRQSPSAAIESGNPGGHWTPFPSFKAYQNHTPNYDAMPSGHIATFMATITVIATNYPEIKWIRPVGYSLMGILAFEMVSSKVHWASDYPLAILIGYALGKQVANKRIVKQKDTKFGFSNKEKLDVDYSFSIMGDTKFAGITITF